MEVPEQRLNWLRLGYINGFCDSGDESAAGLAE
jgi:hypothetical protein